jgi:hypothetical protein
MDQTTNQYSPCVGLVSLLSPPSSLSSSASSSSPSSRFVDPEEFQRKLSIASTFFIANDHEVIGYVSRSYQYWLY